jgi:hypothetical protein
MEERITGMYRQPGEVRVSSSSQWFSCWITAISGAPFCTEERILAKRWGQTKEKTMKEAIGLDKRTKGREGSVLGKHWMSQIGIVSESLVYCFALFNEIREDP